MATLTSGRLARPSLIQRLVAFLDRPAPVNARTGGKDEAAYEANYRAFWAGLRA